MALLSAVRAPISHHIAEFDPSKSVLAAPLLWASFLTLLVAGPWLLPGYLFGTDWPGPRHIAFPTDVSSSALLQAVLAATSLVVGGEASGKILVLACLWCAAFFAYRAVPVGGFIGGAVAATVYVVNPFVYGRLQYGQLFLLAGYALFPWVAARFHQMLRQPGVGTAIIAALSLTLLGILSLHMILLAAALLAPLLVATIASADKKLEYIRDLALTLLLTGGAALVASAYWIIPLFTGRGPEGSTLASIGVGSLNAFAVVPDQQLGLVPNVLGLYGFWAEAVGRFDSMKRFVPVWPAVLILLLILCGIGALAEFRKRERPFAPWVAALLAAGALAVVLETGVSHPLTAGLVRWLDANFSAYRGMRDAGKWAALLALVYSQLAALGAVATLDWTRKRRPGGSQSDWVVSVVVALLLAVPMYYGNGLLYGAHGEIKPSQYPEGWYAADRMLASDSHPGRTLFLPWHEYLGFGFIRNQNKVVGPPGPAFFSVPLLVSADPELPGVPVVADPDQIALYNLVREGARGKWAEVLAGLKVKYVLLARDVDWASYDYLNDQAGLVMVEDFGSIILYRNSLFS